LIKAAACGLPLFVSVREKVHTKGLLPNFTQRHKGREDHEEGEMVVGLYVSVKRTAKAKKHLTSRSLGVRLWYAG
jgi:hypothetical protein